MALRESAGRGRPRPALRLVETKSLFDTRQIGNELNSLFRDIRETAPARHINAARGFSNRHRRHTMVASGTLRLDEERHLTDHHG
ncbi:hypothetical protein C6Q14_09260 [Burkholderia ambifaria]|nr:hypothetical protein C6Q14_09260 [Burkholderia ambifaria]